MSGSIELDPDGKHLQIRFAYRPDLVERVKTLQGRRWDRNQKLWRVPKETVGAAVEALLSYGFTMAPEVSGLLAGVSGGEATQVEKAPVEEPDAMTVGALNHQIQRTLQKGFPEAVWVVGEILDYDKSKDRKHVFFQLVEKMPVGDQINAQANLTLFADERQLVQARLRQAGGDLELQDGMQIRVLVKVEFYPRSGRCQLVLKDIDPSFTLGQMALGREKILAELRQRGLMRRNLERPLPLPALRIAVLASTDSDGWMDFRKELGRGQFAFDVVCFPVKVQGELLEQTMLEGLRWFAERSSDFDLLCILRGGGSRTDLSWFDNHKVAIAVAKHPLKVFCGIGHERDRSVLDEITHSEKTPTAVAARLVSLATEERDQLLDRRRRVIDASADRLQDEAVRLGRAGQQLRRLLDVRVVDERRRMHLARRRLLVGTRNHLTGQSGAVRRQQQRMQTSIRHRFERAALRLENQAGKLRLLDPVRVLQRGYALARDEKGKILTSISKTQPGAVLEVQFRDGRARTKIEDVTASAPEE